jgi:hypothetical protein
MDRQRIVSATKDALDGRWPNDAQACDVYGDGKAAKRVLEQLIERAQ